MDDSQTAKTPCPPETLTEMVFSPVMEAVRRHPCTLLTASSADSNSLTARLSESLHDLKALT
jgi:hypothetical protein